jgi:pimeloyl-ACP methyl ester carboxylesterase
MRVYKRWIALTAATLLLCHCGLPQPPRCTRVPAASRVPSETLIAQARQDWAILGNPALENQWPDARTRYNAAVAKLFDQLNCAQGTWDTRAAALGTRIAPAGPQQLDLAKLDAVLTTTRVKRNTLLAQKTTEGVGVPLVGWRETSPVGQPREKFLLPNGLPYNITATLAFDQPGPPQWLFAKRWNQDEIPIKNSTHTLAADWSAPNAFLWWMCELDDLTFQNVFLPDRFTDETAIYFVTPYDPEKIPLVFVHGLVSSPDAFKNTINELAAEPWFRQRYQIWLYNYPTGNPWSYSAMKFREVMRDTCDFARTQGHDRNLNRMVVVSHSMGGLLTRASVTDPKTALYDAAFKKPFDQLNNLSEDARNLIREGTLYQPLTEPERVVFMAVPHRGSPIATLGPAVWISKLIRLPKTLTVNFLDATLLAMEDVLQGEDPTDRVPTSINSLSPYNRATIALNQLPLPKEVTFHSIIGDRSKGNTPDSSDGVVPYWSSQITPVASEKIVPSDHSVPDCPQAAKELHRILKIHLEE